MIKKTDIYEAVILLLQNQYPTYKTYGHEVTEGYEKPAFFVDLIPRSISNDSINYKSYAYTIIITYFQDEANEADNLKKADELQELFGYKLKVKEELFNITNYSYEFIGQNTNVLQVKVNFDYIEFNEKKQGVTAAKLYINK